MNVFNENKLIGDIYDAALNPSLWRKILTDIRDATNSAESTCIFYDAQCRSRNFASAATANDGIIKTYLENFIDHEITTINKMFSHFPDGAILSKADIMKITGNIHEDNLGDEYVESVRIGWELNAGISLIQGKIISSSMGVYTYPNQPNLSSKALLLLQRLSPHIMQAMRIYNHTTSFQTTYHNLYSVLNAVGCGVFLLGESREVLFSNNEAARMIEAQCGLCFAKGGILQHTNSQANSLLQQAIIPVLEDPTPTCNPLALNFALKHAQSDFPLQVNIVPIHHEHAQHFSTSGASLALFIKDPNKPLTIPKSYLQQAYQLTDTEIVVAQLLLEALDTATIAEQRNTSLETTRGHIKQILRKTNTHSQAELVGLLTSLSNEL